MIQKRLSDDNLPVGIAILLYGTPGTGKTESVLQIAKATGRDIVHVDISEAKSAWFGASAKNLKIRMVVSVLDFVCSVKNN